MNIRCACELCICAVNKSSREQRQEIGFSMINRTIKLTHYPKISYSGYHFRPRSSSNPSGSRDLSDTFS